MILVALAARRIPPRGARDSGEPHARIGHGAAVSERVSDDRPGDELPEDLDVTAYVGPYVFPDIKRRRIAGTLYAVIAAFCLWAGLAHSNGGFLFAAVLLLAIAAYHFVAGWPLKVDQTDALAVASRTVGIPRRARVGAARVARAAVAADVAHLALQRRRTTDDARARRARRGRRARDRRVHRTQPRRLVAVHVAYFRISETCFDRRSRRARWDLSTRSGHASVRRCVRSTANGSDCLTRAPPTSCAVRRVGLTVRTRPSDRQWGPELPVRPASEEHRG